MLKTLSDLFQSIGIHPIIGGFLLGVGFCLLFVALKRAIAFDANPNPDNLARFRDPSAFSNAASSSGAASKAKISYHADGADRTLPEEISQHIFNALQEGQKIEAIKLFKDATGLGLKESKDIIEALQRKSGH